MLLHLNGISLQELELDIIFVYQAFVSVYMETQQVLEHRDSDFISNIQSTLTGFLTIAIDSNYERPSLCPHEILSHFIVKLGNKRT